MLNLYESESIKLITEMSLGKFNTQSIVALRLLKRSQMHCYSANIEQWHRRQGASGSQDPWLEVGYFVINNFCSTCTRGVTKDNQCTNNARKGNEYIYDVDFLSILDWERWWFKVTADVTDEAKAYWATAGKRPASAKLFPARANGLRYLSDLDASVFNKF